MSGPPKIFLQNACEGCAKCKTDGYFTIINHPPDKCCSRCRDFSYGDRWATNPDYTLAKFIEDKSYLKPHDEDNWIQLLATFLTKGVVGNTEKARILFTWIGSNITQDTERDAAVDSGAQQDLPQPPEFTLQKQKGICIDITYLYKALADACGLTCNYIGGLVKGYDYIPMSIKNTTAQRLMADYLRNHQHAWNVVYVDNGVPKIIDVYNGRFEEKGLFGPDLWQRSSAKWFDISNEEFALTHFSTEGVEKGVAANLYWKTPLKESQAVAYMNIFVEASPICQSDMFPGVGAIFNFQETHPKYLIPLTIAPMEFQISFGCEHALPINIDPFVWALDIHDFEDTKIGSIPIRPLSPKELSARSPCTNTLVVDSKDRKVRLMSFEAVAKYVSGGEDVFVYLGVRNPKEDKTYRMLKWKIVKDWTA